MKKLVVVSVEASALHVGLVEPVGQEDERVDPVVVALNQVSIKVSSVAD